MTLDALLDDLARAQKEARDLRQATTELHEEALRGLGAALLMVLSNAETPRAESLDDGTLTKEEADTILWVFMARYAAASAIEALEGVAPVVGDHPLVMFLARTGEVDRAAGCAGRELRNLTLAVVMLGERGYGPRAAVPTATRATA